MGRLSRIELLSMLTCMRETGRHQVPPLPCNNLELAWSLVPRYLVSLGCIKPLCDLLTVMDSKIVQVALNGLENILRLGEQEGKRSGSGVNPYCGLIEEAYGMCPLPIVISALGREVLGQSLGTVGLQSCIHICGCMFFRVIVECKVLFFFF